MVFTLMFTPVVLAMPTPDIYDEAYAIINPK